MNTDELRKLAAEKAMIYGEQTNLVRVIRLAADEIDRLRHDYNTFRAKVIADAETEMSGWRRVREERDEARAEVDRLTAENEALYRSTQS